MYGRLVDDLRVDFHRLIAHEYVELELMQHGLPYRQALPENWASVVRDGGPDFNNVPTPRSFGAHDLAPIDSATPWRHWQNVLGLDATPLLKLTGNMVAHVPDIVETIVKTVDLAPQKFRQR